MYDGGFSGVANRSNITMKKTQKTSVNFWYYLRFVSFSLKGLNFKSPANYERLPFASQVNTTWQLLVSVVMNKVLCLKDASPIALFDEA